MNAIDRARWLAELALAVDHAQQLARELSVSEFKRREVQELNAQLEAIRVELEMLRRGRPEPSSREIDPKWTDLFSATGRPAG